MVSQFTVDHSRKKTRVYIANRTDQTRVHVYPLLVAIILRKLASYILYSRLDLRENTLVTPVIIIFQDMQRTQLAIAINFVQFNMCIHLAILIAPVNIVFQINIIYRTGSSSCVWCGHFYLVSAITIISRTICKYLQLANDYIPAVYIKHIKGL